MNGRLAAVGVGVLLLALTMTAIPSSGYREGPPIDSDGSTHQFLMDRAVAILEADGHPEVARWMRGGFLEEMKRGTIRADQSVADSREHYHDPGSHAGLWGFRSAADLSREQFDLAVARWTDGDRVGAGFHLGWAVHCVQDATVPHHARLTPLDSHSEYEAYVLANQDSAAVGDGGMYGFPDTLAGHFDDESDAGDWVDRNAHLSYERFSEVSGGDPTGFGAAMRDLLPLAQRTTAGFVWMFLRTVNAPPIVEIEGPPIASVGSPVTLEARVVEDVAVTGIQWRMDGSAVAGSRDLVVSLPAPGSFSFDVSVTDAFGVVAGDRYIVDVGAVPFAAIIRGPTRVAEGELVTFSATTDPPAPIETIDWFVDGAAIGAGPDFSSSFGDAGIVRVEAIVRVASGAVARGSRVVIVEDLEAPLVNLPPIFFARVGEPLALDAWEFVQAGDVVRVVWYAGGEMRTSRLAEFTFQGESKQTLKLIAYDSEGNFGIDSAELSIGPSDVPAFATLPITPEVTLIALVGVGFLSAFFLRRRRRRSHFP